MSAIFDFSSLITVFVLSICTTTYLRELRPAIFDTTSQQQQLSSSSSNDGTTNTSTIHDDITMTSTGTGTNQHNNIHRHKHHRDGMMGFLWKLSRIGERCSPYISIACILQAFNILFWK
jgi:hypothetical protein